MVLLAHEIRDGPAVTDYQAFIAPLIPKDILEEFLRSTAGIALEAVVSEHDLIHPGLGHQVLECGQVGLP